MTHRCASANPLALSSRKFNLATPLLRRAAEVGSAEAYTLLAHLFGFGVRHPHCQLFIFERDSIRGIAWGVLALSANVQRGDASMIEQTLSLLCTLVCAPAALDLVRARPAPSLESQLDLPNRIELFDGVRPRRTAITHAGDLWECVTAECAAAEQLVSNDTDPEPDHVSEHMRLVSSIRTGIAFLRAFDTTRRAFAARDVSLVGPAYEQWTACITASRSSESPMLRHIQSAAVEGQQWAASVPENGSSVVSSAEAVALFARIGRIFPYAPGTMPPQHQTHMLHRKRSSLHLAKRHASAPPGRLSGFTPSAPATAVSSDAALASGIPSTYSGTSSTKLRSVTGTGVPHVDYGAFLSALHERPRRRRPSSVRSVTPSLMFPDDSEPSFAPAIVESDTAEAQGSVQGEARSATARLRRQASSASLKA